MVKNFKLNRFIILPIIACLMPLGSCASWHNLSSHKISKVEYGWVDNVQAKDILSSSHKPVLIDVRTPQEYSQGHIEGARNIDFLSPDFTSNIKRLSKNKEYMIYCKSGNRSEKAQKILEENGIKKVYNLKGGYSNWEAKGQ